MDGRVFARALGRPKLPRIMDETNDPMERKVLVVRLPAELHARLEEIRAQRSKASGRRLSLRALVEEILAAGTAEKKG